MYLFQIVGGLGSSERNLSSSSLMYIVGRAGDNLVPMAMPYVWVKTRLLNFNTLLFSTYLRRSKRNTFRGWCLSFSRSVVMASSCKKWCTIICILCSIPAVTQFPINLIQHSIASILLITNLYSVIWGLCCRLPVILGLCCYMHFQYPANVSHIFSYYIFSYLNMQISPIQVSSS